VACRVDRRDGGLADSLGEAPMGLIVENAHAHLSLQGLARINGYGHVTPPLSQSGLPTSIRRPKQNVEASRRARGRPPGSIRGSWICLARPHDVETLAWRNDDDVASSVIDDE